MYNEILAETPSNLLVLKRKVAVYRAQGNMKLAVESLNDIVKLYQTDSSSWLELSDIYLTLCDYNVLLKYFILYLCHFSFFHLRFSLFYQ